LLGKPSSEVYCFDIIFWAKSVESSNKRKKEINMRIYLNTKLKCNTFLKMGQGNKKAH
jgi:hypothetical protein